MHITYYIEREREIHIFPYHHSIFLILPKNLPLRCSLIFHVFFPFTANPWPAPQRASRFCSPRKRLRNSRTERGEAMICSAISAACTTWEPCWAMPIQQWMSLGKSHGNYDFSNQEKPGTSEMSEFSGETTMFHHEILGYEATTIPIRRIGLALENLRFTHVETC